MSLSSTLSLSRGARIGGCAAALAVAGSALLAPAATAQTGSFDLGSVGSIDSLSAGSPVDEWPEPPNPDDPTGGVDRDDLLTPENPEFWNVGLDADRIISPFGLSTRVVCTSSHGVTLDCWQADREGTPHKLVKLPYNFPSHAGETKPGGGPGTFVYADASAWSDS